MPRRDQRVRLGKAGRNLLTADQASFETSVPGGTFKTNCTLAQTAAQALHGTNSCGLTVTANAAANGTAASLMLDAAAPAVVPGDRYTALWYGRCATAAHTARIDLSWLDASRVFITGINGSASLTTSGWVRANVTGVPPANARYAVIGVTVTDATVAAEVLYFDQLALHRGDGVIWTPGT